MFEGVCRCCFVGVSGLGALGGGQVELVLSSEGVCGRRFGWEGSLLCRKGEGGNGYFI